MICTAALSGSDASLNSFSSCSDICCCESTPGACDQTYTITFPDIICQQIIQFYSRNTSNLLNFTDYVRFCDNYQKWREMFGLYDEEKRGKIACYNLTRILIANGTYDSAGRTEELYEHYKDMDGMILFPPFIMCVIESLQHIQEDHRD